MEQKKNVSLIVLLIIVSIVAILGIFGTYYFYNEKTKENKNNKENETINNNYSFSEFAELLSKNNKEDIRSLNIQPGTIISNVRLKDGNVYFTLLIQYSTNEKLKDQIYTFIANHQKEINNKEYKLPLEDVILIDTKTYGQDGSTLILMETKNGDVYSYIADYAYFNSENELNIKKEENLKNIIHFGQYTNGEHGGAAIFGIDINGNYIEK